jgi:Diaminopimelate epimerase
LPAARAPARRWAAGIRLGLLDSPVRVHTRGGRLTIAWDGGQIRMTGPAMTVFQGSIDIDAITP